MPGLTPQLPKSLNPMGLAGSGGKEVCSWSLHAETVIHSHQLRQRRRLHVYDMQLAIYVCRVQFHVCIKNRIYL